MFFSEPFGGVIPGARGAVLAALLRTGEQLTGRQVHSLVSDDHRLWSSLTRLCTCRPVSCSPVRSSAASTAPRAPGMTPPNGSLKNMRQQYQSYDLYSDHKTGM